MKKVFIIIIGVVALVALTLFGYNQFLTIQANHAQAVKIAKQKALDKKKEAKFEDALMSFKTEADSITKIAKEMGDGYQSVWHDTIFNSYVTIDDVPYFDFNSAIAAQKQIYKDNGDADTVQEEFNNLNGDYQTLQNNVTSKNKDTLSNMEQVKSAVSALYQDATTPSGALADYTSRLSEDESTAETALTY